ncbi:hypothetical protein Bbelb_193840 [Branchiostoma belcheri]|nr:hypothetical protein Bbelb_193840 [Branchiostoma belcheri]
MEEETDGTPVEDGMNHVLSVGSTSRNLQTAYLIISLVLSVGCGLLLIFLVWKKEYLHKPSHYLRCNLAVDDIIFTGCLIPVCIYAVLRQDASGAQLWCTTKALVAPACMMSMYGTYIMMAVDLYYFVCDPLHYHDKVTTRRVVVGILAFRAFSLVGLTPVAFGGRQVPTYSLHCEMTTVPGKSTTLPDIFIGVNVLVALLAVLFVTMIYYLVFKEARRQQERDENRDLWVFQTKAFKVMVPHAIVLAAALTTALFHAAMVRMRALISEEQMSQRALIIADRTAILLFLTLSSLANPFIYSFRLPEFRRACRELCGLRTNPNPPVVPARRYRQDDAEMAAVTGPGRRGAPASELASAPAGPIMQPTAEDPPADPAEKQTTQEDTTPGPASRAEHQTASGTGRPFRLTVRAEVHAKPTPRPEDNMTVTLPGQLYTDAEAEDVPTLTLDTENNQATTGHTSDRPPVRTK